MCLNYGVLCGFCVLGLWGSVWVLYEFCVLGLWGFVGVSFVLGLWGFVGFSVRLTAIFVLFPCEALDPT